ncbi:phage head closure protein [Listeria monocytogenes]|nr:phage head closure protein [Listeria monocytogenes]EIA7719217.1 phage head closure protein [Listeria monocytogenes]
MQKVSHDTFNDGVLFYGISETVRDSNRKRIGANFVAKGKLFYEEMSMRDQDVMRINAMGKDLNLKIKTHYRKEATSYQKIQIEGIQYEVSYLDKDRNVRLFWYLTRSGDENE